MNMCQKLSKITGKHMRKRVKPAGKGSAFGTKSVSAARDWFAWKPGQNDTGAHKKVLGHLSGPREKRFAASKITCSQFEVPLLTVVETITIDSTYWNGQTAE